MRFVAFRSGPQVLRLLAALFLLLTHPRHLLRSRPATRGASLELTRSHCDILNGCLERDPDPSSALEILSW